jgi:two-component system, chemotaxis family, sensor kinase CheA
VPGDASLDAELINEFIDDYYAECDEHLTAARTNLMALEGYIGRSAKDPDLLDALLRGFHSIKGLSGMVGVGEAEQLAHEVESSLRELRQNQTDLTPDLYSALLAATTTMEQIMGARRAGQSAPDLSPVIAALAQTGTITAEPGQPATEGDGHTGSHHEDLDLAPGESAHLQAALGRGATAWVFTFVSSPELAQRGINVNAVRARLGQIGELIQARPHMLTEGKIAFKFLIASTTGESYFASWQADGLTYQPYAKNSVLPVVSQEASASSAARPRPAMAPSNIVRVDLARLDELMQRVGDLVIGRARLANQLQGLESVLPAAQWRELQETNLLLDRQLRDLREAAMRVRLVPIGDVFTRMQFVIHDLARAQHKQIVLEVSGQATEIDKRVVERMMDPLLHLVRNAVSHGLELPDERVRFGKSPEGRISLRAATEGDMVVIWVADDGRGIDLEQVTRRARDAGLLQADAALDANRLLDILCAPGFSTRAEADLASGRGIGMAVAQSTVQELGGALAVRSETGQGTTFRIQLPLTLAIIDALIVTAGDHTFAVPQLTLREIVEVPAGALRVLDGAGQSEVMIYRDGALPILRLARLFRLPERKLKTSYALVVSIEGKTAGILVDRVRSQREIVVRAITDPLLQVPGVAGATELGDGHPVLILEPATLLRIHGNDNQKGLGDA